MIDDDAHLRLWCQNCHQLARFDEQDEVIRCCDQLLLTNVPPVPRDPVKPYRLSENDRRFLRRVCRIDPDV